MYKINKELLIEMIEAKYVMSQKHPTLPLTIYNYSKSCQYEKVWNEITLQCRGLVLDDDFNVVAIPFKKFFNYEEHDNKELPLIPENETYEMFEKMDGSLGISFRYNGELIFSTRGSFISDQAIKAKEILKKYNQKFLFEGFTYLFEIIYSANRIVVDYGKDEKLTMLGVIDNVTGEEWAYDTMVSTFQDWDIVKKYGSSNSLDFKSIQIANEENKEGRVLKFESGFRIKIKFEDYCRLHSIVTNITARDIWYMLKEEKDMSEILDNVPDEFFNWVQLKIKQLKIEYNKTWSLAHAVYYELISRSLPVNFTKKDFAIELNTDKLTKRKEIKGLCFLFLEDRNALIKQSIWRMIRPGHETPFLTKENNNGI